MLIKKICDSVDSDSRNVSETVRRRRTKDGKVSEIVRRRRTKDSKVSDSLDDLIAELEAIPWHATDEVTEQVKKIVAKNGTKTIKKDGKEILTFAESQSGTPMYSYKQHAWTPFDEVKDGGVTRMSDIGSNRPGKLRTDSSELSKFQVKLRDVEEVRKRFKDAGIPLYWSGQYLYADASEDKVKEVLEGFDYQIMDSAQADQMSYSWEEFADKVGSAEDATSYSDHVVVSGDKAYRVQITEEVDDALPALAVAALTPIAAKVGEKVAEKLGDSIWGTKDEACQFATRESANKTLSARKLQDSATVVKSPKGFFKIVDRSGRSYKGPKITDSKTYTKDELLAKRPSWVADSAIWEKAVNMITDSGANSASAKSSVILYKRLGGKRVADSKMVKAQIVDDLFQKIDVGDTLRVVNGDNPGRFGEVLSINEDGSYLLRDLKTKEEFSEPSTLYGVFVNVVDSKGEPKIEDAMDSTSLRKALSVILETPDYKTRQEALTSKVATFLNLYGSDVEVSAEDGTIWLNDDNTKVKVDDNKVWIMRPDEEAESYGLLDEIETWFARIKELSAPATEALSE